MREGDGAEGLLADLLRALDAVPSRQAVREVLDSEESSAPPKTSPPLSTLGTELGERLVSEILDGVRAGRQGVFVSDPERLRTAIFVRGLSLGEFARRAGIAPSTLSRALAGQPVSPASWRLLIGTLRGI